MKTDHSYNFKFAFICFIGLLAFQSHAQDPSSILDLESSTQGLLAPRMTTAERTAIVTPAQGLMVYDIDSKTFWYFKDTSWNELGVNASPWLPAGASIYFNTGNVAIGTTPNSNRFLVEGPIQFRQTASRTFYIPSWVPSSAKQVIGGVFTGEGVNAPVIRYYAPNGDFSDTGIDTLGSYLVKTADVTKMTVLQNGNVGIGTTTGAMSPAQKLVVESNVVTAGAGVINATFTHVGNQDRAAVRGISTPALGYGYGIYGTGGFMGVRGEVPSTAYSSSAYGGYFTSSGTAGTRYGVYATASNAGGANAYGIYGSASGATSSWAGYFGQGNVFVTNDLLVGNTTGATGYKVSVDGKIACEEVLIDLSGDWPDYVFNTDYDLKTINELKQYIAQKGHLPGVPSAQEIEDNGIILGEMNKVLMEKVEELTLYIIQQEESNEAMKTQLLLQQEKINAQEVRLHALENRKN